MLSLKLGTAKPKAHDGRFSRIGKWETPSSRFLFRWFPCGVPRPRINLQTCAFHSAKRRYEVVLSDSALGRLQLGLGLGDRQLCPPMTTMARSRARIK